MGYFYMLVLFPGTCLKASRSAEVCRSKVSTTSFTGMAVISKASWS